MGKSVGRRLKESLNISPYRFQIRGVRFLEARDGSGLICDDMGVGKTIQSLGWLAINKKLRPAIVVCPSSLKYTWQRELRTKGNMPSEVLEGRTPYKTKSEILIINYEILQYWIRALKSRRPSVLIIDEFQYIKNRTTKRTKACLKLSKICPNIIGLSGTPVENRPSEFYPMLNIAFPEEFPSWWDYAFKYCDPKKGWRGRWDFQGSSNLRDLHRRLQPFMIRRLKTEVLKDLPPKQRIPIIVKIDNMSEYENARDDFLDWLEKEEGVEAVKKAGGAMVLVRMGKLKQLAAKGKMKTAVNWIKDYLDHPTRKLVVMATHRKILSTLFEAFPKAVMVAGRTSAKKKDESVEKFQTDPKTKLFIGQRRAAGVGLTLTAASAMLMLELGWHGPEHEQAEDRILRIGQEASSVEIYYMIGKGTIEEWLLEVIHEKKNVTDEILEGRQGSIDKSLIALLRKEKAK